MDSCAHVSVPPLSTDLHTHTYHNITDVVACVPAKIISWNDVCFKMEPCVDTEISGEYNKTFEVNPPKWHKIPFLHTQSLCLFHYCCHHKFFMRGYFQYYSKKKSCLKEGVRCRDAPVQAVLPKSGWILYAFFKVHRHFGVFFVYSRFNLPVSLPATGCRWNRVADEWYPRTGSSQPLLSWWHRDTKCQPGAGQADTTRLLPRKRGGAAAPSRVKEERRAPTSHQTPQQPRTGGWNHESQGCNETSTK